MNIATNTFKLKHTYNELSNRSVRDNNLKNNTPILLIKTKPFDEVVDKYLLPFSKRSNSQTETFLSSDALFTALFSGMSKCDIELQKYFWRAIKNLPLNSKIFLELYKVEK